MPRRVADYAPKFARDDMFISLASFGFGASVLVFLYNMDHELAHGPIAPSKPWRALRSSGSDSPRRPSTSPRSRRWSARLRVAFRARSTRFSRRRARTRPRKLASHEQRAGALPPDPRRRNETVVSAALVELIEEKAKEGPST